MDVVLEFSQVEALIFNYVSFGFFTTINSFLTVVAVLTAAISFWRIRTVGSIISLPDDDKSNGSRSLSFYQEDHKTVQESEPPVEIYNYEEKKADQDGELLVCSSFFDSNAVINDGTVKGKFMVHYYKEEDNGVNANDDEDQLTVTRNWKDSDDVVFLRVREVSSSSSWEQILQLKRTGDLGYWYGNQDLTSLNGSVVKLWGR